MKSSVKISIIIVLIGFLSTSCSNSSKSIKLIPKEASNVTVIDPLSLAKKGNLYHFKDYKFVKTLLEEFKNEDIELYNIFNKIFDDIDETGIDFKKDIFIFSLQKNNQNAIAILATLSSKSKFRKFIDKFSEFIDADLKIVDGEKYKYIEIKEDGAFLAWNNDNVMFVANPAAGYYYSKKNKESVDFVDLFFNLKSSESISSDDNFKNFYNDKKDISFYTSFDHLYSNPMLVAMLPPDFKGTKLYYHTEFNRGNVKISTKYVPNEHLKNFSLLNKNFNKDILKYLPEKTYVFTTASVDFEQLLNFIKAFDKTGKFEKGINKLSKYKIDDFAKALNGTYAFSLHDFKKEMITYKTYEFNAEGSYTPVNKEIEKTTPKMTLVLDINNSEIFEEILSKSSEKVDGNYMINLGSRAYVRFKDNIMMITNDLASLEALENGGYKDNFAQSDLYKKSDSDAYSYVELNLDKYPTEQFGYAFNNKKGKKLMSIWNNFAKNIEVKQLDNYNGVFLFNCQDDTTNSLKLFFDTIEENYEFFMNL